MKYGAKVHQEIPTCCYTRNSRFLITGCVYERPGQAQVIRPTVALFFSGLRSFLEVKRSRTGLWLVLLKAAVSTTSLNSQMLPDKRCSVHSLTLPVCLLVQVCKIMDTRRRISAGVSSMEMQVFRAVSHGLRVIRLCQLIIKQVQPQSAYGTHWTAGTKEEH
jgi:hypothetical protein